MVTIPITSWLLPPRYNRVLITADELMGYDEDTPTFDFHARFRHTDQKNVPMFFWKFLNLTLCLSCRSVHTYSRRLDFDLVATQRCAPKIWVNFASVRGNRLSMSGILSTPHITMVTNLFAKPTQRTQVVWKIIHPCKRSKTGCLVTRNSSSIWNTR
jgi:hypothetical protein